MKLIPDWKQAWKWHSTQMLFLLTVLPSVWAAMPEDVKAMVPSEWNTAIVTLFAIAGLAGRLRDQK